MVPICIPPLGLYVQSGENFSVGFGNFSEGNVIHCYFPTVIQVGVQLLTVLFTDVFLSVEVHEIIVDLGFHFLTRLDVQHGVALNSKISLSLKCLRDRLYREF
jgi:hypothetical protein